MKKGLIVLMSVLGLVAFSSCGSKKSAAEAAKAHHEKLMNKDYKGYVEAIYFGEVIPPVEVEAQKSEHARILEQKAAPKIQSKGGISRVTVKDEKVAPDKKSADVTLTHTYNDGTQEDIVYAMVMDAPTQQWKVKMGPDKEVWRTVLPDGTHETFKLKEDDHREIFKENIDGERDFVKEIDGNHREVEKIKVDGEKDVEKIIERGDETIIKEKVDGEKEKIVIPNE